MRPKKTRPKIQSYMSPELHKRVRTYAAAQGASESALVQAALAEYLDRDQKDNVLIMRRTDRLTGASLRHERDLAVSSEAFAVFVQLWLGYTPELADSDRDSATRSALRRYQKFVDHVAAKLAAGSRLASDVFREEPAPTARDAADAASGDDKEAA